MDNDDTTQPCSGAQAKVSDNYSSECVVEGHLYLLVVAVFERTCPGDVLREEVWVGFEAAVTPI
jgi:hypothetical protein